VSSLALNTAITGTPFLVGGIDQCSHLHHGRMALARCTLTDRCSSRTIVSSLNLSRTSRNRASVYGVS